MPRGRDIFDGRYRSRYVQTLIRRRFPKTRSADKKARIVIESGPADGRAVVGQAIPSA